MSIEEDIIRLNTNSVVHGAFLLSLFEAHPDKDKVIDLFEDYAKIINDLAIDREISDAELDDRKEAFAHMPNRLKGLYSPPSQE